MMSPDRKMNAMYELGFPDVKSNAVERSELELECWNKRKPAVSVLSRILTSLNRVVDDLSAIYAENLATDDRLCVESVLVQLTTLLNRIHEEYDGEDVKCGDEYEGCDLSDVEDLFLTGSSNDSAAVKCEKETNEQETNEQETNETVSKPGEKDNDLASKGKKRKTTVKKTRSNNKKSPEKKKSSVKKLCDKKLCDEKSSSDEKQGASSESRAKRRRGSTEQSTREKSDPYPDIGTTLTLEVPILNDKNPKQTKAKRFTCEVCGSSFTGMNNLRSHQYTVHAKKKKEKKIFRCEPCGKTYTAHSGLYFHRKAVHQLRRFVCRICGKHYSESCGLKHHVKAAHEAKKYPCNLCGKVFARPGGLNTHNNSAHLGKRYNCPLCPKSFSQGGTLARHRRESHGLQARTMSKHYQKKIEVEDLEDLV